MRLVTIFLLTLGKKVKKHEWIQNLNLAVCTQYEIQAGNTLHDYTFVCSHAASAGSSECKSRPFGTNQCCWFVIRETKKKNIVVMLNGAEKRI